MNYENIYRKNDLAKIRDINALAPDVMEAFWAFDKTSLAGGAIPVKYKELIALDVAVATRCPYCIDIHGRDARAASATESELIEAEWSPLPSEQEEWLPMQHTCS